MTGPSATEIESVRRDLKRLSLRGGVIVIGAQSILFVLQMISVVVLARLLAPEAFGLLAIATFFTGFLALFGDLGLGQAVVQRHDLDEEKLSALFWINLGAACALGLLTAALAPAVAWAYGRDDVAAIMLALASAFPITGSAALHRALLTRQMRNGRLKAIEVTAALGGLTAGIVMGWLGYGFWALVTMTLVGAVTSSALMWRFSGWRPALPGAFGGTGGLLRFGLDITGYSALNYFARNADDALIGWLWGPMALGFYTRAYALLLAPLRQLNQPLSAITIATLSRLAGEPALYAETYRRVVEKILLITMPLVGLVLATPDLVIEILLGPRWAESAPILFWLGIAALYQPLAHTTGWLFISQGRTRELLHWGMISVPITIASFLIGLPFGTVGVAAAYAWVGLVILVPLLFWFVGRTGPVGARVLGGLLASFSVLTLVAGVPAYIARYIWERGSPLFDLAVSWGVALPIVCLAVFLLGPTRAAALDSIRLLRDLGNSRAPDEPGNELDGEAAGG